MIGLLGPNGAGKTTLLKILSTLIEPDSGSVFVLGHDVARHPMRIRGALGLVTCDERSFYWRLSGMQNLMFFATLYGLPRRGASEQIGVLLETLGLTEAAHRPYHSYSSGMRQKLAIARGLLSNPKLVLYDEPTRSLDPLSAQNIRKWIAENRVKFPVTTHIIATNQLHEAEQLCDRVLILNRGEIVANGSIAEIRRRFGTREHLVHRMTCSGISIEKLAILTHDQLLDLRKESSDDPDQVVLRLLTTSSGQALSYVLHAILASGGTILRCETEQVGLDEVFCSVVSQNEPAELHMGMR